MKSVQCADEGAKYNENHVRRNGMAMTHTGAFCFSATKQRQRDSEFAASRGLDFQFVSNVINLEFPLSVEAYIHRVGRTARANNKGTALNFVSLREMPLYKVSGNCETRVTRPAAV